MVGVRTEAREFSLVEVFRPALGPHRPFSKGTGGCFPRVQRSGREAVHAPPSSAKVKYEWNYRPTPPYIFMT